MNLDDRQSKSVLVVNDKLTTSNNLFVSAGLSFFVAVVIISFSAGVMRLASEYLQGHKIFNFSVKQQVFIDESPDFTIYFPDEEKNVRVIPKVVEQENKAGPPVSKVENWFADWIPVLVAQAATNPEILTTDTINLTSPPIRVGLFWTKRVEKFSSLGGFQLFAGEELVLSSNGQEPILMWYDSKEKKYFFTHQNITKDYEQPLRLQGLNQAILQIDSYANPPSWNQTLSDNQFRGSLEIYHATGTDQTWIINELPLEDYLKGLGETRSTDHIEYLKTMTVVGRTYAYWHKLDNFKHGHQGFHIDAFYDQVYRGYANELRHPELVKAVEETHGEVVTYQGEVAITPYFARSNGRTKNWSEVWYQDPYPWIKSVVVPEEKGFSQLGHGVGLSGVGAMIKAKNGETYQDIIKYFYHDVEIKSVY